MESVIGEASIMRAASFVVFVPFVLGFGCAAGDVAHEPASSCQPDPDCGSVARERFTACMETTDQAACEDEGGTWDLYAGSERFCRCPTGQETCCCRTNGDCRGACVLEQDSSSDECREAMVGTCTAEAPFWGCACRIGIGELCTDPP